MTRISERYIIEVTESKRRAAHNVFCGLVYLVIQDGRYRSEIFRDYADTPAEAFQLAWDFKEARRMSDPHITCVLPSEIGLA